jgi:hypothetical protein
MACEEVAGSAGQVPAPPLGVGHRVPRTPPGELLDLVPVLAVRQAVDLWREIDTVGSAFGARPGEHASGIQGNRAGVPGRGRMPSPLDGLSRLTR